MTPTPKSRVAASAPSISACGALSLPIPSRTTLPVSGTSFFDLDRTTIFKSVQLARLRGPCSNHISGTRDAVGEVHDNWDKVLFAALAKHHGRDACRDELSNVAVLDLA